MLLVRVRDPVKLRRVVDSEAVVMIEVGLEVLEEGMGVLRAGEMVVVCELEGGWPDGTVVIVLLELRAGDELGEMLAEVTADEAGTKLDTVVPKEDGRAREDAAAEEVRAELGEATEDDGAGLLVADGTCVIGLIWALVLWTRGSELETPTIVAALLLALEAGTEEVWMPAGGDVEDRPGLTGIDDD